MVLKGLALAGAVAAVAVAIVVALTFQPAPAVGTQTAAPANVLVLPNGMAAPQLQLQPGQQGAVLADTDVSLVNLVRENIDRAEISAAQLKQELTAPSSNAAQDYAVLSCGGK